MIRNDITGVQGVEREREGGGYMAYEEEDTNLSGESRA
jgi:hypothetical protein